MQVKLYDIADVLVTFHRSQCVLNIWQCAMKDLLEMSVYIPILIAKDNLATNLEIEVQQTQCKVQF